MLTVDLSDTNKSTGQVKYYIDGFEVQRKAEDIENLDGRFSFLPAGNEKQLLLFGDNDNDDGLINVSEVIIFDRVLSAEEVEALGGYGHVFTSVEKTDDFVPETYSLNQNYPNPFNPTTIISYSIPEQAVVSLKVYNILGQLVNTLVNEQQSAGNYKFQFNASQFSSGIYFYTISTGNFTKTQKMILMK
jgi:hypothetical protein